MSEGSEARTFEHMKLENGSEGGMGKSWRGGTESQGDTETGNGLMKVNKALFFENYW